MTRRAQNAAGSNAAEGELRYFCALSLVVIIVGLIFRKKSHQRLICDTPDYYNSITGHRYNLLVFVCAVSWHQFIDLTYGYNIFSPNSTQTWILAGAQSVSAVSLPYVGLSFPCVTTSCVEPGCLHSDLGSGACCCPPAAELATIVSSNLHLHRSTETRCVQRENFTALM